jgi:hypothetical protein
LASNRPGGRTTGNNAGQAVAVVPGVVSNDAGGNGSPASAVAFFVVGAVAFFVVGIGVGAVRQQPIIGASLVAARRAISFVIVLVAVNAITEQPIFGASLVAVAS